MTAPVPDARASRAASVAMPSERSIIAVATAASAHPSSVRGMTRPAYPAAACPPSGPVTTSTSPGRPPDRRTGRSLRPRAVTDTIRTGARERSPPATGTPCSRMPAATSAASSNPGGRPNAASSATGRAPIAARSERLAVAARWPTSRGVVRARSKCTPSTRMSVDTTVPSSSTAASSPIPRTTPPDGSPTARAIAETSTSSGSMARNVLVVRVRLRLYRGHRRRLTARETREATKAASGAPGAFLV